MQAQTQDLDDDEYREALLDALMGDIFDDDHEEDTPARFTVCPPSCFR